LKDFQSLENLEKNSTTSKDRQQPCKQWPVKFAESLIRKIDETG